VKRLIDTFESDWIAAGTKSVLRPPDSLAAPAEAQAGASPKETAKAVAAFTEELQPLAATVREAVRQAVAQAGEDVLHDKDVKDTMKKVAKQAIKEAVKDAVQDAVHDAQDASLPKGVT
jgi:histone H3/H4